MSHWALIIADLLLTAGFTARLTRLVITDDLGLWYLREPVNRWADNHKRYVMHDEDTTTYSLGWRGKLALGLECPYCIGFWCAGLVLLSLALVGGPGDAAHWWRYIAGWFSLNWLVAHVGVRLGDAGFSDDE